MAAASFADELRKWHKQLQTIEAVLIVWLKVQQLWVQLEEVCTHKKLMMHSKKIQCSVKTNNIVQPFPVLSYPVS